LAHQWFGDLVTCKDWSHVWLNEGWASYMEPVWYEFDRGQDEYDLAVFQDMEQAIRGGKERPVVDLHYQHPDDMFDSRAYPKGASILHMLRQRLGDELFWRSVQRYLTENAHQPVETSDFRKAFEQETGRSLERFFYDWTARPGHPVLDVRCQWNQDEKFIELSVKQTQEAEAFHFPLEIECRFEEGEPITLRLEIAEKEHRLLFPLRKRPALVIADPREAVLKEIKENKSRDMWVRQLTEAPYITARIRAARHFGETKSDQDVELLAKTLSDEKFWGVGAEIAKALGAAGGHKARDALIEGLTLPHPKVRRAVAEQLGNFYRDEKVSAALYSLIQAGDPSYAVEAEAIESYGKLQPDDALPFLTSLLTRDSHREQIRSAALEAIGRQKTPAGLEVLFDWSKPGRPGPCRGAAVSAMAALAQAVELKESDRANIVDTIVAQLSRENARVKRSAIEALRAMGSASQTALPALRALSANDPSERIRRAAKEAAEKIAAGEPAPVQMADLRSELDKLRDENRGLRDRLEKLEARGSDGPREHSD
jgi:aminopeptidase N